MTTLSIIIPVYNEKNTIKRILKLIEQVELKDIQKEIIIVDDKSTDGTRETLERLRDKYAIIFKEKNEGKGAAIKQGFLRASGDIILIQDADLEYNPNEYSRLIGPILDGQADVVYGSRFIGSEPHRVLFFWHYQGNRLLTHLSNMLSNLSLTDIETCYKAFNRQALDKIKDKITSKRFGIEPEITALVAKNKLKIYEIGISYYGRTYSDGKKITWRDGLAAVYHIVKFNLFK
ncbi:MAG: glycosyl transferase [Candidatus Portnoybacteria bacterium RIFCSPLOWO2_01_FULL_43_11]|uniref:Glycosyl transferase n=4 Tax=Bacteria candidate phyla TaxID=1783234 RepID=A0A1G2FRT2_9BACT|nr:MAG: glycosyl transferase [candidate division WWE3 bacterium RIFCSPHIGHO2_01_FULL_35_17]OGZ37428.1 MAG: glycosyl transferase [Candidatus Portnoybacteria bacterium RIFCSPHIGHO2_12_FULL_40_11]OGZ38444.1 MAG: glycosyl transferase [Candidatus Portnoybacteria bacterium RIFCSPLOWO2_01_FULL_43_11]OGZ40804.1 MAG: glycosyl transferase [Candidatus Portnoybacteria bacterium RIFCSPLOWO2_02_FULL_40_15]